MEVAGTGAKFSGVIAVETHTDANVYVGTLAGNPRVIFGGSTTHEIDVDTGSLRFIRPSVVDLSIDSAGEVFVAALKTTGAATGKTVVCVDTATGQLYASTSPVACAN